jgi:hypothetical protein
MSVFKPTLSKAYLTLLLSFSFLFSSLFWLYKLTTGDYSLFFNSLSLWLGKFNPFFSLTIPASYVAACASAMWLTPFWKRKRLLQPTFPKTILAVLFELIFLVVGWQFIFDPLVTLSNTLFPQPSVAVNPCPNSTQFFISLCGMEAPDAHDYIVLSLISLTNAFVSYTLSCFIIDFIRNMKGRKVINA